MKIIMEWIVAGFCCVCAVVVSFGWLALHFWGAAIVWQADGWFWGIFSGSVPILPQVWGVILDPTGHYRTVTAVWVVCNVICFACTLWLDRDPRVGSQGN